MNIICIVCSMFKYLHCIKINRKYVNIFVHTLWLMEFSNDHQFHFLPVILVGTMTFYHLDIFHL